MVVLMAFTLLKLVLGERIAGWLSALYFAFIGYLFHYRVFGFILTVLFVALLAYLLVLWSF